MSLLNSFNKWRTERYENHLSRMKEENRCPDCYGRGLIIYPAIEYLYHTSSFDCPGCNGTGSFLAWSKQTQ